MMINCGKCGAHESINTGVQVGVIPFPSRSSRAGEWRMRWALPNSPCWLHIGQADAHAAMPRYCRDRISDHAFRSFLCPSSRDAP